jgi:hypothetical protein
MLHVAMLLLLLMRWSLVTVLLMALLFSLMPHWKRVQEEETSCHQCCRFFGCLGECLLAPSIPHAVVVIVAAAVLVADHHLGILILHTEAPSSAQVLELGR